MPEYIYIFFKFLNFRLKAKFIFLTKTLLSLVFHSLLSFKIKIIQRIIYSTNKVIRENRIQISNQLYTFFRYYFLLLSQIKTIHFRMSIIAVTRSIYEESRVGNKKQIKRHWLRVEEEKVNEPITTSP